MNANYRNFGPSWVIISCLFWALVTLFQSPGQKAPSSEITFSQLPDRRGPGNVRDVTIAGTGDFRPYEGRANCSRPIRRRIPGLDPRMLYKRRDVTITAKPPSDGNNWLLTIVLERPASALVSWVCGST